MPCTPIRPTVLNPGAVRAAAGGGCWRGALRGGARGVAAGRGTRGRWSPGCIFALEEGGLAGAALRAPLLAAAVDAGAVSVVNGLVMPRAEAPPIERSGGGQASRCVHRPDPCSLTGRAARPTGGRADSVCSEGPDCLLSGLTFVRAGRCPAKGGSCKRSPTSLSATAVRDPAVRGARDGCTGLRR